MRVRRGEHLREVQVEEGRASVTLGEQVIVLSDVASAILQAVPADGTTTLDAITAAVVEEIGAPEPPLDARELTRGLVLELVAHDVLASETPADRDSLSPESIAAVREAVRHVVSADRSGWVPPAAVEAGDFLAAAHRHRVVPVLATAHTRLALPRDTLKQLVAIAHQEAEAVEHMVPELLEAVEALTGAGVRVLAFEGLPLAVQAHGDVEARGSGHHSLLVSPLQLAAAFGALTRLGWAPSPGQPTPTEPADYQRLIEERHELPLTRGGGSVQLHWHLTPVGESLLEFEDLWSRRSTVEIGGHDVTTLGAYDALGHAAHRSALDDWGSLRGLLDVWHLLGQDDTWQDTDGPFRQDQLTSVGLAVRTFGMPRTDRPLVHEAAAAEAARVPDEAWATATAAQATTF